MDGRQNRTAPTRAQLEEAEDTAKGNLYQKITDNSIDNIESVVELKTVIKEIKDLCTPFEQSSRQLSQWLSKHGMVKESKDTRDTRLHLIHGDCRELVKSLNNKILALGEEKESSIGSVIGTVVEQDDRVSNHNNRASNHDDRVSNHNNRASNHDDRVSNHDDRVSNHDDRVSNHDDRVSNYDDRVFNHDERASNHSNSASNHENNNISNLRGNQYNDHPKIEDKFMELNVNNDNSFEDIERLDATARHSLKQDLLRGYGKPFDGTPELFWSWQKRISRRLLEAEMGALDSLYVLEANTTGRANKMVSTFLQAGANNPKSALMNVWRELKQRFGDNSLVANSLMAQLKAFPFIKKGDIGAMEDLRDICSGILFNMCEVSELQIMNQQSGMKLVWEKFPDSFQGRWRTHSFKSEKRHRVSPTFESFIEFINDYIKEGNMPGFTTATTSSISREKTGNPKFTSKTLYTESAKAEVVCAYHKSSGHKIADCFSFRKLSFQEKKQVAKRERLCYACLGEHRIADCKTTQQCKSCNKPHLTIMHPEPWQKTDGKSDPEPRTAARPVETENSTRTPEVESHARCTKICNDKYRKSYCSKTVLVDIRFPNNSKKLRALCILDEQSNTSFIDPKLVDFFDISAPSHSYQLTTMSGFKNKMEGMSIEGFEVKGVGEKRWIKLPTVLTHPGIPNSKNEMASPSVVRAHEHIKHFADKFNEPDQTAEVLILLGTNCGAAMYTRCYGSRFPFVHHTALGYALVGPVCVDQNQPIEMKSCRTQTNTCEHFNVSPSFDSSVSKNVFSPQFDTFAEFSDDDLPSSSQDDRRFVEILSEGICTNKSGRLQMPLPLKGEPQLVDNREAVYRRTYNTLTRLKRRDDDLTQALKTMGKYLDESHVEELLEADISTDGKVNYIPVFVVKHAKKKKVRIVFDSAASYAGKCLNDFLLQGPDTNNGLVGVLTRFRHSSVGFASDIECMFHTFAVAPEHRNLLRFYWFKDNDPNNPIVDYRANVHIFGNTCSPAVANFGLRYSTFTQEAESFPQSCRFLRKNVYVDDCMASETTVHGAVSVLQGARAILDRFKIHLHKIASNKREVMEAFPKNERASDVDSIELTSHNALGVAWKLSSDELVLNLTLSAKPFTRRGVLSTVNSVFDPLGMAAPLVLSGRILQRQLLLSGVSTEGKTVAWDDVLPAEQYKLWHSWVSSLHTIQEISLPRCFVPEGFESKHQEMHVFSDASEEALGYVIYLRSIDVDGKAWVSFVFGNSKVTPRGATSIPRLELCAAFEAAKSAHFFAKELGLTLQSISFYTDSKVVLGYLRNTSRKFAKYVATRVASILKLSQSSQWNYISTETNVADIASRPQTANSLLNSRWFEGPKFLWDCSETTSDACITDVELPETLKEVKVLVSTTNNEPSPTKKMLGDVSTWQKAKRVMTKVIEFTHKIRKRTSFHNIDINALAENILIANAQREVYMQTYDYLIKGKPLKESDPLVSLAPYLDGNGVIRVGGRLKLSDLPFQLKHPVLLPNNHPLTILIARHFHERSMHQGRHITLGAIRQAGYHIHKSKSVISKLISECVICRKLRRKVEEQKMADLPPNRLEQSPPFSHTGIDCFGPYYVHDGRSTRRSKATKKVWAVLFTCMNCRAIHIESLSSMDTATFRLALRRFLSLRGQCKSLQSDMGTNFVGTLNQLNREIDMDELRKTAEIAGCVWKMNTPGASHMGGVWERKIGSVKTVLNATMKTLGCHNLSRDELNTLFQESACIVNNTPLYEVSGDPNDPIPVSPAMLLTLKDDPEPAPPESYSKDDLFRYGSCRWRRVMYLADQFWTRWRKNYVNTLQVRNKWFNTKRNLCVGDLVLVKESSPRNQWPMAKVTATRPSVDGLVRSVTLQLAPTFKGAPRNLDRCVQKLVLLLPAEN